MAAIDKAIRDREHLLVQAGTGTGKCLAYLDPGPAGRRPGGRLHGHPRPAEPARRARPAPARRRGRAGPRPAAHVRRPQGPAPLPLSGQDGARRRGGADRHALRRRAAAGHPVAGRGRQARQADPAAAGLVGEDQHRRPRRARPGRRRHGLAAGLDAGPRLRRRGQLPVRRGVLRRGVPGPRPRGRHRGHQPQPARRRHARRPAHRPAAQAAHRRRGARAGRPGLLGGAGRADPRRDRAGRPARPHAAPPGVGRVAGRGRRRAHRRPRRPPGRPAHRGPAAAAPPGGHAARGGHPGRR